MATDIGQHLDSIAQDLFELVTQISLHTQPRQRRGVELKELEFLALSILHSHQPMIVGDIQRMLGVLPAQMSRIIRALEGRPHPLIKCQINPTDKRKIDVRLTPAGLRALTDHQESRVNRLASLLNNVSEEDREDLDRLIQKLTGIIDRQDPAPLRS